MSETISMPLDGWGLHAVVHPHEWHMRRQASAATCRIWFSTKSRKFVVGGVYVGQRYVEYGNIENLDALREVLAALIPAELRAAAYADAILAEIEDLPF